MRQVTPLYTRWLAKVEKTAGCWLWRGARKSWPPNQYGHLSRGRRGEGYVGAHVFAYEHFVGAVPKGMQVQHTCHNTLCVNPGHLKVGQPKENTQDMIAAGRDKFRDNLP